MSVADSAVGMEQDRGQMTRWHREMAKAITKRLQRRRVHNAWRVVLVAGSDEDAENYHLRQYNVAEAYTYGLRRDAKCFDVTSPALPF
jgi:hypothetical protein